jgi:hypothetical protein
MTRKMGRLTRRNQAKYRRRAHEAALRRMAVPATGVNGAPLHVVAGPRYAPAAGLDHDRAA